MHMGWIWLGYGLNHLTNQMDPGFVALLVGGAPSMVRVMVRSVVMVRFMDLRASNHSYGTLCVPWFVPNYVPRL